MNNYYEIEIIMNDDKKIRLKLDYKEAPITVSNFINLIEQKYFDGVIFHRIIPSFMIQTGGYYIKDNTLYEKDEIKPIKGEFKSNGVENNIKHTLGVISMARTSIKDSATSQFFICAADCPHLDGEYAAFGKTIDEESNKVVLDIAAQPTGYLSENFTDVPRYDVSIKTINILKSY